MRKPFQPYGVTGGSYNVETLADWLRANAEGTTVIGGDYTVADLIKDLSDIDEGIWSDGISALGEDA